MMTAAATAAIDDERRSAMRRAGLCDDWMVWALTRAHDCLFEVSLVSTLLGFALHHRPVLAVPVLASASQ